MLKEAIMSALSDPDLAGPIMSEIEDQLVGAIDFQSRGLATLVGQPGFEDAVLASRDVVLMDVGIDLVTRADHLDGRMMGMVYTAISMGAQLAARGLV